jgi:uncharacterized DUF497 family protein
METEMTWDEAKRQANLAKHGLDFASAGWVLDSSYRLDIPVTRHGEERTQSFAYVLNVLATLLVVHTGRDGKPRIVSFRRANNKEREVYREWLRNEYANP